MIRKIVNLSKDNITIMVTTTIEITTTTITIITVNKALDMLKWVSKIAENKMITELIDIFDK